MPRPYKLRSMDQRTITYVSHSKRLADLMIDAWRALDKETTIEEFNEIYKDEHRSLQVLQPVDKERVWKAILLIANERGFWWRKTQFISESRVKEYASNPCIDA